MAHCFHLRFELMRLKQSFFFRALPLICGVLFSMETVVQKTFAEGNLVSRKDVLLLNRVRLKSVWEGKAEVPANLSILILAGHADSQGISGAGTAGEAVALKGAKPMDASISDELFWNLLIRDAVVQLGLEQGLNIRAYEPGIRNIDDGNHPLTNWSVGARHARAGGYPLEIHFDSYGEYGFGSGLIPAISTKLNVVDESLALAFGRYPMFFRGGLGAPRREIRVLEIGKLEGELESKLRDPNSRQNTIDAIAQKVVTALVGAIRGKPLP